MNESWKNHRQLENWLARSAAWLIVLAAIFYYASYLQYWFNPHDEGGTAALTSMRIMSGETPIREVELGYNVGWFWPIVGLFKLTGANFLVMRGYFFALSTITAVLGWQVVRKLTGREWVALGAGLALVIFPGSQFKNYIPLICVANILVIVWAAQGVADRAPFLRRIAVGGVVLGLSFLIRIDLGYLFALLWIGFLVLRLLEQRETGRARIISAALAAVLLVTGVVAMHVPALIAANVGGYGPEFAAQYGAWAKGITARAHAVVTPATPAKPTGASGQRLDRSTLARVNLATALSGKEPEKTVLFALTYLPPVTYLLLFAWCGFGMVVSLARNTFTLGQPSVLASLALFGSMATFPQFFFFRPDRPHLSEFMPGYIVASLSVVTLLAGGWRVLMAALLGIQFCLFGWYALDHYSAGTIAARLSIKKNKRGLFQGANGVRVWVHKEKDLPSLEGVRGAVAEHSKPGDWLVCYPYQPGYNVMTDRSTYQRNLYQDNAIVPPGWAGQTVKEMTLKQPAVVVIDDRAINQTNGSRFSVWAKDVYDYIRTNYEPCGTFDTVEVFVRKEPIKQ